MVQSSVDNLLKAKESVLQDIGQSSPTATRYITIAYINCVQTCTYETSALISFLIPKLDPGPCIILHMSISIPV